MRMREKLRHKGYPKNLLYKICPKSSWTSFKTLKSGPIDLKLNGPRQANLVLIAYASSEGSGEPAHPRSLARTFAARSYKQWIKRNLEIESQIPGPAEWLGMRSWNLSWRNARRHKFAWRGSNHVCKGKHVRNPHWKCHDNRLSGLRTVYIYIVEG